MKVILLLAAAAALALGAGWFLLRAPAPAVPLPAESVEPVSAPPVDDPPPAAAAPAAEPVKPRRDPSVQPRLPSPDSVPRRPPAAVPPGGTGEILRADRPPADQEKVDAMKLRLMEAEIGEVDWKQQGLRKVLDLIAEKTGVPFEIEGEGLDDEPVVHKDPGHNALEVVRAVTMGRNLRFEVTAEKVIVRR